MIRQITIKDWGRDYSRQGQCNRYNVEFLDTSPHINNPAMLETQFVSDVLEAVLEKLTKGEVNA